MNVLVTTPLNVGQGGGGVGTSVRRLREGLAARGHRALLLLPGDRPGVSPDPPGGSSTYRIRLRGPLGGWKRTLAFCLHAPRTLYALHRFLARENIQIVQVHYTTPTSIYFALLRPLGRWRLSVSFRGSDVNTLSRRSPAHRALLGRILRRADAITAASSHTLEAVKAVYPWVRTPGRAIYNGNTLAGTACGTRRPAVLAAIPSGYVLDVGVLVPRKAHDVHLAALALARDQGYAFNLAIVGGGPEAEKLRALAQTLRVAPQVFFIGEIPHEEVAAFYSDARFVVHCSRSEGLPNALLEAMGLGKAVIASRVGGTPELIRDGDTGLLVDPDDPEMLAAAMIRLEKDADLRARLAARGQDLVAREFTWERCTGRYLDLYTELLGR